MINNGRITPMELVYFSNFDVGETRDTEKGAEGVDRQCCLCGNENKCIERKKYISSSFTNFDYFKAPLSDYLCHICCFSLQRIFTRTSFFCDGVKFLKLDRKNIYKKMFGEISCNPFIFCVTTTYKKHLIFKTRINVNSKKFYIQFDEMGIIVEPEKHKEYFLAIEELYTLLHSCGVKAKGLKYKDRIIQGEYDQRQIKAIGVNKFFSLEDKIKLIRPGGLLQMLCWCANNRREGKNDN